MQIRQSVAIGIGVGLVAVVVLAAILLTRGGGDDPSPTTTSTTSTTEVAPDEPAPTTTLPEDEAIEAVAARAAELNDEWDEVYTVPSCEEGCDDVESAAFRNAVVLAIDLQLEIALLDAEVGLPDAAADLDAATDDAAEVLQVISLAVLAPDCTVISVDAPCAADAAAAVPWLETVDGLIDDWAALAEE